MARPAYKDNQMTAKERMENTFWEMLSSTKYEHITVKELCKRAAVNQNTFYYHFENIDSLATGVFEKDKISEIPDAILHGIINGGNIYLPDLIEDVSLLERWKRLSCFAKDGSPFLRSYFTRAMKEYWLSILGVAENELTDDERFDMEFILAGIVSIIAGREKELDFRYLDSFINRTLGQGVVKTLKNIMTNSQRADCSRSKE